MAPFLVRNYMCIRFIDEVSVLRTDVLNEFPHSHEKKSARENDKLTVICTNVVWCLFTLVICMSGFGNALPPMSIRNDLAIFSYFMEKGELISSKHTTFYHFFPSSSSSTYGWINCIHIKPTTTTLKRVAEMCVLYGSNKNPEWIRYDSFLIHIILHFSCACVCKLLLGMWNMCLFLG